MKNTFIRYIFLFTGYVILNGCQPSHEMKTLFSDREWIDLTHTFDTTTLYWPNNILGFGHTTEFQGKTPGGYFYSSYSLSTPEHGGTHLDAPVHFAEGRQTVDEIPLSSLTGEAVVIDISEKCAGNRDYLITAEDVQNWERANGDLQDNVIVFFRTGYGKFYPDREKYFGTAKTGTNALAELHFPGIDSSATRYLVEKRNIKAIGLDTPSMDFGQSRDFITHRILLEKNKPGFENVANLEKLPIKGIYVVALPMKVGKGSGAPLRIIASVSSLREE